MKPARVARGARLFGLQASIRPEPLGVVGIIAPWNFPVNLAVVPAAAALAAGNRVMIKMSEKTPRTAEVFAKMVADRFSDTVVHVVTGGPDVASGFSALDFDHLLFTGSPAVGREVMRSAAANLVPVTLELGGKNPAVIGPGANIEEAADRIARARLSNGGQICMCPDYVYVPDGQTESFVSEAIRAVRRAFPSIVGNELYCSVIDAAAFDRITALVEDARAGGATVTEIVPPGEVLPDPVARKIPPTILTGVTPEMRISNEEVFGPVLTVHTYEHIDEVIGFLNSRPAPLASYWYGPSGREFDSFCRRTRSGGVSRNDFALHASLPALPFGGVGNSGMGSYHGKYGFDTFSHYRPIAQSDLPFRATTSPMLTSPRTAVLTAASFRLLASVLRSRLRHG